MRTAPLCRTVNTRVWACAVFLALPLVSLSQQPGKDEFAQSIRPILAQNCLACHNPANPKLRVNFLKAATAKDVEANRGLWRDVATQLRNRTMPPGDSKITEDERLRVAQWIDKDLRQTACDAAPSAGAVAIRRLNRREYHNTIRDLLGVDYNVSDLFPVDGTGGAGFDTNGETLYVPPLLMERYLEAAQQILDRVIVTPALSREFPATAGVLAPGAELAVPISIYADADYTIRLTLQPPPGGTRENIGGLSQSRWRRDGHSDETRHEPQALQGRSRSSAELSGDGSAFARTASAFHCRRRFARARRQHGGRAKGGEAAA